METTLVHASIPSAKAVLRLEMQALRAGLAAAAPRAGELAAARKNLFRQARGLPKEFVG